MTAVVNLLLSLTVLLSGVTFAGGMAPFGLSLTGGTDMARTVAAALGAALGALLFSDVSGALKTVSAAALICFLKIGTAKLVPPGRRLYVYTASVFASSFVCALIVTAAQGLTAPAALRIAPQVASPAARAAATSSLLKPTCALAFSSLAWSSMLITVSYYDS